jgi:putative flippase GtrA
MLTFIRVQAVLILGSLADFAITILLVSCFHDSYVIANVVGNITGSIAQFILSRNWAFEATEDRVLPQVLKFSLVWAGQILLSAAGIYLFTHYIGWYYLLSKTVTSVLLGVTYTYLLKKHYVFA